MKWSYYIDESYNQRTFCVGGWLASEAGWAEIQSAWLGRIEHENRISAKKGMPPISRYHATYCANLKKEFSQTNGWDESRQILLTKKLCRILGENLPWGIVYGGAIADVKRHFPYDDGMIALYKFSFAMNLIQVGQIMEERSPDDRVTVYYERSKKFGSVAADAFGRFMNDPAMRKFTKHFVTAEPKGWEDCTPLQAADFIAYEGMKWADKSLAGNDVVRKSLGAMRVPLTMKHFTDENFQELGRMIENSNV